MLTQSTPIQSILHNQDLVLDIKRLDQIHPFVSGNKFFKLKYNLQEAVRLKKTSLITFGGAYSNHIVATAYAAKQYQLQSIGIIRGDELANKPRNATLQQAQAFGMQLQFVNRTDYKQRHDPQFLAQLQQQYPNSYIIPEGGTNQLAIQGCQDILTIAEKQYYDVICVAVGTGGTIAGLIESTTAATHILGFSALKGDFLKQQIESLTSKTHWTLHSQYHFGGYAKISDELIQFIQDFEQQHQIPLEPIYTGKMMYGMFDLIAQNYFPKNSKILLIHSGGLQGKASLMP
ncbi:1-aminocyclopropane-1-carboxylate deaminase/D-cysteine desulfhydrase [Acinetobacter rathckeae]|uniref:1-aminocyclopropane-1-carboxylate deaminase/D-cysteine desulfhydrase n=1 Tax=Acinetobacter rathckeae TaxID=2605272 RepID=UPI0018A257A0|nr:pyridoxal-phosphate dependent enzyme [Acinetobacter rathckeae]MBF7686687.1 1-aminocyclopropane-1-carboxylate deaminase/D-cysteine desulfhydrase [Acinetobacter rathckeae]MBF7696504.1 1-aminocyclopropane-1-carboxylate deaminase/D-cysteine desulfhydrase [Acinetobacter rathckeae]